MKNRERIEAKKLFKNYLIKYFFTIQYKEVYHPYLYTSEERDSKREIGNCLTRALTDSHTCTVL